ncbi:MAG TPA: hypothetical protein VK846_07695 [Candidatus Limnocylindria bacterium]|nr:hypothetical protein [Candidatus Limnocylindria bacterium]
MARQTKDQEKAFEFLRRKFDAQETFSKKEFLKATNFKEKSFDTYFSKQFSGLLKEIGLDQFRVSGVFRQFRTWKRFSQNVVSQKRKFVRQYVMASYGNVVIFEFYLPLRNELWLRETLDAVFFRDSVRLRLIGVPAEELAAMEDVVRSDGNDLNESICDFVSEKFGGYSITLVNGRFRANELKTRTEVMAATTHEPYLIDETTAVVKFIVPCTSNGPESVEAEAEMIRVLFNHLFVQSILELVNGEDEIWVLESGIRYRLQKHCARD